MFKIILLLAVPAFFGCYSEAAVLPAETLDANGSMPIPIAKYEYSLPLETRHNLNKAHGILMVLSWLFFVPSAFVFARMLRDFWSDQKPFGLAAWFHVHRTLNFIGIILMVASFICIMISKDWRWTGPGSHASYNTKVHTITGLLALILAWLQPFISLLRCGPTDARRSLFNWAHRMTGVLGFALATTAFVIAATQFRKLWQDELLQTILVLSPTVILLLLIIASVWLQSRESKESDEAVSYQYRILTNEEQQEFTNNTNNTNNRLYSARLSLVCFAVGILFAVSITLCIMIAQGYKPKA